MSEENIINKSENKRCFQLAVLFVVYGSVFNGSVYGFSSPALVSLKDNSTGIGINEDQASWIASVASLGIKISQFSRKCSNCPDLNEI